MLFTNRGGDDEREAARGAPQAPRREGQAARLRDVGRLRDRAAHGEERRRRSHAFLDHVRDALKAPAKVEIAELMKEHVAARRQARTTSSRRRSATTCRIASARRSTSFDSKELSNYFEVRRGQEGPARHHREDVRPRVQAGRRAGVAPGRHRVRRLRRSGKPIGRFYLDLYSRARQVQARRDVRRSPAAKRLADGSYQLPVAALECNFPKPGGATPALMIARGRRHVLPRVRPRAPPPAHARASSRRTPGTPRVRDFVEAPSPDVRGVGLDARRPRSVRAAPQDRREDPRRALHGDDQARAASAARSTPSGRSSSRRSTSSTTRAKPPLRHDQGRARRCRPRPTASPT